MTGKMIRESRAKHDFPAVGDWVAMKIRASEERAAIHAILPRHSKFTRQAAGFNVAEQVIAANIDTVFLVTALNNDFNIRRMERYLTLAWESGANPVFILNKADICDNIDQMIAEVESVACDVPIHAVSAVTGHGLDHLTQYLRKGETLVLLGSSGAGKSTLVNTWYGQDIQTVNQTRQGDDKGRHTTTYRRLMVLPEGAIVIDTPGLREIQLWGTDDSLNDVFKEIAQYEAGCRFRDCSHDGEPDCMVKQALEEGKIEPSRYESYLKLKRELGLLSDKRGHQEKR
jgi:ribosome biogenesis GTPase